MSMLARYPYPGNVRELKNMLASVVLMAPETVIRVSDLPQNIRSGSTASAAEPNAQTLEATGDIERECVDVVDLKKKVEILERTILGRYAKTYGSTYEIAQHVGIHQTSVSRKLRKYGISTAQHQQDRRLRKS